jgi:Chalcone isomerase-like
LEALIMTSRSTLTRSALTVSAALILSAVAFAMTRPAEIGGVINATKPYGSGSLSWLIFTAYDASLWTDAPQWSMDRPFALTLDYRMSFSTQELVDSTLEELAVVAPGMPAQSKVRYRPMLMRAFPPVKSGDRITALHTPGAPVQFFHNGRPTADSVDAAFAEPFFAIWLSPRTSEPKLRAALLRIPG